MVLGCNYNDCAFGCENEYHVCFELLGKVFCLLERERVLGLANWCTVGCSLLISPSKVGIIGTEAIFRLTHVYIADNR